MAHFAKIEDGIVTQVIVVTNEDTSDENGVEQESIGVAHCVELLGASTWVQTSYNSVFRKNYAGTGYTYDSTRNAFISPQPYPSWLLVESTCQWESPIARPDDGKMYDWDEDTTSWVEVE